jgi:hypothetical protein
MALKQAIKHYKSVNEFLDNFADAVKGTSSPEAIGQALPWVGILGEAVAETVAPVKFILKLYEGATKVTDFEDLAEIACTVAFQRSVQQVLNLDGKRLETPRKPSKKAKAPDAVPEDKEYDFSTLGLETATQHPFYRDARQRFGQLMTNLDVPSDQVNRLLLELDRRFPAILEGLITNGETADKFAPVFRHFSLDSPEKRARHALRKHAVYQRWLYEERRVLQEEPYSLQHVYVLTDCGDIRWGDIEKRRQDRKARKTEAPAINPFLEGGDHGGRHDLLTTVMGHLGDPDFAGLIVIQGPPGTGKSSFTLRLVTELIAHGVNPIRIELKYLDTAANRNVRDTLPEAVRLGERAFDPSAPSFIHEDGLFLNNTIFNDPSVVLGKASVSPHVLILDAWDEISVGTDEAHQQHIERLLREVRGTFLSSGRNYPVRVIITGRPTEAVTHGRLLADDDRLLTLRYFTAEQLADYHAKLDWAVTNAPRRHAGWEEWTFPAQDKLGPPVEAYRGFREKVEEAATGEGSGPPGDEIEVLGSPLLGFLAVRLLVAWPGDPMALFRSSTVLYRGLVDLLLGGGKLGSEAGQTRGHLRGEELRQMLRSTAEAMTVLGEESLSRAELLRRVTIGPAGLEDRVKKFVEEKTLGRLLVSFFFHGGHDELGCEFSHKSFREYLFAEQVVEVLKDYGRSVPASLPELDRSTDFARDFPADDPRRSLAHRLVEILGPRWVSRESSAHIMALLEWEVQRSVGRDVGPEVLKGEPTAQLGLDRWRVVRDALADVWDWWTEGVHLRPRAVDSDDGIRWEEPLALAVCKRDRKLSVPGAGHIRSEKLTTIDGRAGEGLLLLCASVHAVLLDMAVGDEPPSEARSYVRRYQRRHDDTQVRFAPGGMLPVLHDSMQVDQGRKGRSFVRYVGRVAQSADLRRTGRSFALYLARIVAAGAEMRPPAATPRRVLKKISARGVDLSGVDLSGVGLSGADLSEADLRGVDLRGAFLAGARVSSQQLGSAANTDEAHGIDQVLLILDEAKEGGVLESVTPDAIESAAQGES